MYVVTTPPKCSKCGSTANESFFRQTSSGIRCLSCGHEKVQQVITSTEYGERRDQIYKMEPHKAEF